MKNAVVLTTEEKKKTGTQRKGIGRADASGHSLSLL